MNKWIFSSAYLVSLIGGYLAGVAMSDIPRRPRATELLPPPIELGYSPEGVGWLREDILRIPSVTITSPRYTQTRWQRPTVCEVKPQAHLGGWTMRPCS